MEEGSHVGWVNMVGVEGKKSWRTWFERRKRKVRECGYSAREESKINWGKSIKIEETRDIELQGKRMLAQLSQTNNLVTQGSIHLSLLALQLWNVNQLYSRYLSRQVQFQWTHFIQPTPRRVHRYRSLVNQNWPKLIRIIWVGSFMYLDQNQTEPIKTVHVWVGSRV